MTYRDVAQHMGSAVRRQRHGICPEQCQRVLVRPTAMTPARRIVIGLLLQGVACEPECVLPRDDELGVGVIVVAEGDQVRSREQAVGHLLDPCGRTTQTRLAVA